MAELLKRGLEEEDYSVSLAFDERDALKISQALEYAIRDPAKAR